MKAIVQGFVAIAIGIALFVMSLFIISPTVSYDAQHAYLQNLFDGAGIVLTLFGILLVVFSIRAKKVKTDDSKGI